jgi:hypothetical protein
MSFSSRTGIPRRAKHLLNFFLLLDEVKADHCYSDDEQSGYGTLILSTQTLGVVVSSM